MSRMQLKIIILILIVLTVSSGIKAIQINVNQKLELKEYEALIHSQLETVLDLEVKLNERLIQMELLQKEFESQKSEINEAYTKLYDAHMLLTVQYEMVKSQNIALTDKIIYLTFDDGPSPTVTGEVLDILKQYDIRATFFVQGRNAVRHPELIKRVYDEGHIIGNHSYSHNYNIIYQTLDMFWADFQQAQEAIYDIIGVYPQVFRFPGGSSSAASLNGKAFRTEVANKLLEMDMQYYDWDIDSGDAAAVYATAQTIRSNTMSQLGKKKRAIVLFHDTEAKKSTVEALPGVIEYYLSMGYRFDILTPNGYTAHHN